jgi:hypothetical protein
MSVFLSSHTLSLPCSLPIPLPHVASLPPPACLHGGGHGEAAARLGWPARWRPWRAAGRWCPRTPLEEARRRATCSARACRWPCSAAWCAHRPASRGGAAGAGGGVLRRGQPRRLETRTRSSIPASSSSSSLSPSPDPRTAVAGSVSGSSSPVWRPWSQAGGEQARRRRLWPARQRTARARAQQRPKTSGAGAGGWQTPSTPLEIANHEPSGVLAVAFPVPAVDLFPLKGY